LKDPVVTDFGDGGSVNACFGVEIILVKALALTVGPKQIVPIREADCLGAKGLYRLLICRLHRSTPVSQMDPFYTAFEGLPRGKGKRGESRESFI